MNEDMLMLLVVIFCAMGTISVIIIQDAEKKNIKEFVSNGYVECLQKNEGGYGFRSYWTKPELCSCHGK